jgi:hypothetical protein
MIRVIQIITLIFIFTGCSITQENIKKDTIIKSKSYTTTVKKVEVPKKKVEPVVKKEIVKPKKVVIVEEKKVEPVVKEEIVINKLAIVFPSSSIGKYALEATNSINTYLLYKKSPFELKVYDMFIQNEKNIIDTFSKLQEDNITKAIVMITKENLLDLNSIENIQDIKIYLPLINKNDVGDLKSIKNLDIVFGAISYKDQFAKLIEYTNGLPLVEFYDNSGIGHTLHSYLKNEDIKYKKRIDDNNGRYKKFLESNSKLTNSAVILNTPIVKSSILLSAISGSEDIYISQVVSTQLNYTPLLFLLTQKLDRKKLVVANSIGKLPKDLEEYNTLMGNNILYSWVNYSTVVGIEYLVTNNIKLFEDLSIEDSQVIYPVKLYKVGDNSFNLIQ